MIFICVIFAFICGILFGCGFSEKIITIVKNEKLTVTKNGKKLTGEEKEKVAAAAAASVGAEAKPAAE